MERRLSYYSQGLPCSGLFVFLFIRHAPIEHSFKMYVHRFGIQRNWKKLDDLKGKTLVCSCPSADSLYCPAAFLSSLLARKAEGSVHSSDQVLSFETLHNCNVYQWSRCPFSTPRTLSFHRWGNRIDADSAHCDNSTEIPFSMNLPTTGICDKSCGSGTKRVGGSGTSGYDNKFVCTQSNRTDEKYVLVVGNSQFRTFATG